MLLTIDRVGRVVIPKDIRHRLVLGADADVQRWRDADQR